MSVEKSVSIVLPTYNRAGTLPRAIDSVLRQTHKNFELIVVDDGSTDDTALILRQFTDPRISVIRLPSNKGVGAARNAGIEASRYDLVAFQDSDDVWFDNKLELTLAALSDDIGVVYHDIIRVASDGTEQLSSFADTVPSSAHDRIEMVGYFAVVWCLMRKELIESVGGFDEVLVAMEDADLLIKLSAIARFARVPQPLVYYYDSPDGLSKNMKVKAESLRRLIKLHEKELSPFKSYIVELIIRCARYEKEHERQQRAKMAGVLSHSK